MISENSFFQKIPAVIDLKQRLIWEAAGWAIQMISLSYDRLKAAAAKIDTESAVYPVSLAPEIFACCWSMIDQCHKLRKILERVEPPPRPEGLTYKFLEKFKAATLIRNAMDHLHEQINNVANDKGPRSPLFGALSFYAANDNDVVEKNEPTLAGCRVVTLTAGALTHPKHAFRVFSNVPGSLVELPVGQFQFEAFDHNINLSDMIIDLAALVHRFDTIVKSAQEKQLREFAQKNGIDEDKIINEHHGAVMVVTHVEFLDGDSNTK